MVAQIKDVVTVLERGRWYLHCELLHHALDSLDSPLSVTPADVLAGSMAADPLTHLLF